MTTRDKKDMRIVITIFAASFMISALLLLLTGCAKEPVPVFITTQLPDPPPACVSPSTPEPKLNDKQDASDLDAVKDRGKLKTAFRTERNLRKTCGEQLKVLLPKGGQ